jgi:hypothetical protein
MVNIFGSRVITGTSLMLNVVYNVFQNNVIFTLTVLATLTAIIYNIIGIMNRWNKKK